MAAKRDVSVERFRINLKITDRPGGLVGAFGLNVAGLLALVAETNNLVRTTTLSSKSTNAIIANLPVSTSGALSCTRSGHMASLSKR